MASETVSRLREATRDEHQRLEDSIDIFGRVASVTGRRKLVERFYGLHAGAERALAPLLGPVEGLDYQQRSRLPFLTADVRTLGGEPTGLALSAPTPPADRAEALGVFYVLEGSTLGGHVIRKRLQAGGDSDQGLSFLDPYREKVGERWRTFLTVLERDTPTSAARDQAIKGALAGFAMTQAWLCAPGEAA